MDTKNMTVAALQYTRRDLNQVIEIQEKSNREYPGSCKKLGFYWDELSDVLGELKKRGVL